MALSPLQEGLYSLTALADFTEGEPADDPYVIGMSADVFGTLDVALLRDCAAKMLVRHPNLRASFFSRGIARPVQIVPSRVDLPWRDVVATEAEIEAIELDERRRPFDLERLPALRFLLIELPDARWRLTITAHHIVIDGWSLPVFVAEMMILYRAGGDLGALPIAPRPYRDYIGWLAGRDQEASQRVWRDHLAELPGPTLVAAAFGGEDAARTATRLPQSTELRLDAAATDRLVTGARSRGVTLNTLLQMAWATIVSRLTDRDDVVFGVTVSGRPAELAGVETMVGLFINTVPLRVRLDPSASVGEQSRAVQRDSALLRDHSYLGHAQLRAMGGVGEMYDTLLVYENFPTGAMTSGDQLAGTGVTFEPAAVASLTHFPIVLAAHMDDGQLVLMVEVIDGAIGHTTAETLGGRLRDTADRLLQHWDRPLSEVSVLTAEEVAPLGTGVAKPATAQGIHTRFAAVAGRTPDSPAVTWAGGAMTYRELDEAANRLAGALAARGATAETPIAIRLPRGPRYVVAILAVLKAGAMYVPLEPGMPAERVDSILRQSGAGIVIDESFDAADGPADFEPVDVDPGRAAYVVFTSGTTGEPKGVIGTHAAVNAYADDHLDHVLRPAAARLARPLRIAHAWSFAFDAAWQPLVALLDGHVVHVVDEQTQTDAEALVAAIAEHGVDMIDTTPSMFAQLRSAGLLGRVPLAVLALGGEALGGSSWSYIRAECARTAMTAFNCYGPTETTVEAVVAAIDRHDEPSIGHPTGHTRGYVLDSALRPVAHGVAGELYLGGAQLVRGYLGRAPETVQRFIADPFVRGERMYRTGDLVRRHPDGSIQYIGRADAQVKIRGHRVEPGEVAVVLEAQQGVRQAHVAVRHRHGVPRLVAYVAGHDVSVNELRGSLVARLPRYMVPQRIVLVDEIPLTGNGKLDETALAAIDVDDQPDQGHAAPETATESALAEVLVDLLQIERINVDADFFELGIDSIVALSIVHAARARGIPLRPRLILQAGTLRELAALIDAGEQEPQPDSRTREHSSEPIQPVPIVSWVYEYGNFRRFSQSVVITLPPDVTSDRLETALQAVLDRHDMLRGLLEDTDSGHRLTTRPPGSVRAGEILQRVAGPPASTLAAHAEAVIDTINPAAGAMIRALWCDAEGDGASCLLLVVHHLATDAVSWYVLLAALSEAFAASSGGAPVELAPEYTTYREWAQLLDNRSRHTDLSAQRQHWVDQLAPADPALGSRLPDPSRDTWASLRTSETRSSVADTQEMLDRISAAGSGIGVREFLLAAVTLTLTTWRVRRGDDTRDGVLIALEGHGREDALFDGDVDTSATVGWFTNVFPVRFGAVTDPLDIDAASADTARARGLVTEVAQRLAAVPNGGLDYGLLRYSRRDAELVDARHPQVEFNYLGRLDMTPRFDDGNAWTLVSDPELTLAIPLATEPELPLRYTFDVIAVVQATPSGPQLLTNWIYSDLLTTEQEATELGAIWRQAITTLGEAL
ncbi:amino acid adenylation domain-containing protein [Candidatus Mycobacterium wuenschmannii]|uniref:Amino acid adenylation domain-containing protein n=1 Tax=Candidatus Mycobacterium wuenschmannii TaxID=3027808 RepID=A0ABY8W716_9MYCO|nr:amino acid adenylation domain-containing protein [Candidatus Mycobacterium wuenschmannii]WIM90233.1 amino acid adenylation domain-containing protein [Candidatus Mycobacterium wuenschmannii]